MLALGTGRRHKTSGKRAIIGHYHASFVTRGNPMQEEAEITINGIKLTDAESMTIRVAVDTLANVLAEDLGAEGEGQTLADRYMTALTSIQSLLDSRQTRKQ
jgi:hypothetical protein